MPVTSISPNKVFFTAIKRNASNINYMNSLYYTRRTNSEYPIDI